MVAGRCPYATRAALPARNHRLQRRVFRGAVEAEHPPARVFGVARIAAFAGEDQLCPGGDSERENEKDEKASHGSPSVCRICRIIAACRHLILSAGWLSRGLRRGGLAPPSWR